MNIRHRVLVLAAIVPAVLAGGCYTALKGPATAADFYDEPRYTTHSGSSSDDELLTPSVGRFSDPYDDPYRGFSGVPYGGAYGGYGTPVFGYDSRGGLFGNYGYGGYYPGSGPVGYGYDPYYSGAYGTYVPPGYELVTTNELDQLRASAILNNTPPSTYEPPDPSIQQERERVEEEVWQQRKETRQRTTPVATRRPSATAQRSTAPPPATRKSTTAEKSTEDPEKKSAAPKKRGR